MMITMAPPPRWTDLARAFHSPANADSAAAPWLRPGDRGVLAPRSSWSLAAIAGAIAARKGRPARVMLPAWICNQSLWPLRQTGAVLNFVPVGADGHPDWGAMADQGPVDMVVAVHTFGHPHPLAGPRHLADAHGALLVEDGAHCLMPGPGLHDLGDVVLYSPHKLLALPDGGVMAISPGGQPWADDLAQALGRVEAGPTPWRWLIRRLVQRSLWDDCRAVLPLGGQPDFLSDPPTGAMAGVAGPSPLAMALMAGADLAAEARARRANMAALRALTDRLGDLAPVFPAGDWVPYRLAVRAATPQAAERYYRRIRVARLPVESWPDLPPEVLADPRHQAGAVALRRSVLLLPVHGALRPEPLALAYAGALA